MADRLDILDLLGRYAHAYDGGDRATLESLFTDDAEFHIHGNVGRVPATMVGRDTIVAALVGKWEAIRPEQRRHIATNLVVLEQGATTARAASYLALVATSGGTTAVLATGRYEDDLVKGDDGRWRIHRRHATTDGDVP